MIKTATFLTLRFIAPIPYIISDISLSFFEAYMLVSSAISCIENYFEKHIVNTSVRNIQPCSVKKYMAWNTKRRRLKWSRNDVGHFQFRKQRRKSPPITYTRGIMTLRLFPIQDGHLPDEV
jgi:hypothetical protein